MTLQSTDRHSQPLVAKNMGKELPRMDFHQNGTKQKQITRNKNTEKVTVLQTFTLQKQ
jgi:hypothetical protein